jgi:hypothetical protein
VRADYLVLADAVAAAEGKLYIHGAGWDTIYVLSFPAQHPTLGVAARLRVPWEATNQQHLLEIDVVISGEDGNSILPEPLRTHIDVGRPANLAPGSDQLLPIALSFANLQFREPGSYAVVLRTDGRVLTSSTFHVVPFQGPLSTGDAPNP